MSGIEREPRGAGASALLDRYRPDGLLLVGSDFFPAEVQRCLANGVTVVRLGSGRRVAGLAQVALDERAGMARLVGHLRELGHARIGYLAEEHLRSRRRAAALCEALGTPDGVGLACAAHRQWTDPAWVRRLPDAAAVPTAWIAFDDMTAIRAMRLWREAGVDVPGRFSVAGVDDIPAAALVTPALTTLRQPVHAMVQAAYRLLVSPMPSADERMSPGLVARASCARYAGLVED